MQERARIVLPDGHSLEAWRAWLEHSRHRTALGPHEVELESVDDNGLVMSMKIGDHARQPYGLLHGGISMMLAESAASVHACWKVDLTQKVPVGIEISGSHLRSATEGTVLAVATQLRRSAKLTHHEIRIELKETGKLLSLVRMTNMYRPAG